MTKVRNDLLVAVILGALAFLFGAEKTQPPPQPAQSVGVQE